MSDGMYVKGRNNFWAVYNGARERISRVYQNDIDAIADLERRLNAAREQDRNCMKCTQVFRSEGTHHRLCNNCKTCSLSAQMTA